MFGGIDREGVPLVAPDDGCDETGGVRIDFDVLSAPSTFRQSFHVRHRLGRYGAGRCLDFETSGPKEIAAVSDGPGADRRNVAVPADLGSGSVPML